MSLSKKATQSRRAGLSKKNPPKKQVDTIRTDQAANLKDLFDVCGITISQLSYGIRCDVTSFSRTFTSKLSSSRISPDQLQTEIEYHLDSEDRLKASLDPLDYTGPPEYSLCNMGQPTLVRLLLDIHPIQPFIISFLLSRLERYSTSPDTETANEVTNLIITQLRWISKLVNPREFSTKILRILTSCPLPLQRLVVLCLPDIVPDSEHTFVAQQLKQLLPDTNLTAVIVDTIDNFNLTPDLINEFRESAMKLLAAVSSEDLEYLLKFILHPSHQAESDEVVSQVRSSEIFTTTREENKNVVILRTLDSIMKFQPMVLESWLRLIEHSPAADIRAVDLCTLCLMYGNDCFQGRVQTELKSKFREGISLDKMLEDMAIIVYCLEMYSTPFYSLFEVPLLTNDSDFTFSLILSLFLTVGSDQRQTLIDFLLRTLQLEPKLDPLPPLTLLSSIVESDKDALLPFLTQLQDLYTELGTFLKHNIISYFELTGRLALHSNGANDYFMREAFHEAVSLLLGNVEELIRYVGVIGVTVGVKILLDKYEGFQMSDFQLQRLTKPILNLKKSLSSHPSSLSLFYTELAGVVRASQKNDAFLGWVITGLEKEFRSDFMVSLEEDFEQIGGLHPCAVFGLREKPHFALNLLNLVHRLQRGKLDRPRESRCILSLLPQLQLLSICYQHLHGSWQHLDSILSSPILLVQQDELAQPANFASADSPLVAACLLLLAAWLCELVNVYSGHGDSDPLVFQRLSQLILVERLLQKYAPQLSSLPRFLYQPLHQAVTATHLSAAATDGQLSKFKNIFTEKGKACPETFSSVPLYDQLTPQSILLIRIKLSPDELKGLSSHELWNTLPINLDECTFLVRALKHKLERAVPLHGFGAHAPSNKPINISDNNLVPMACVLIPHLCTYLELVDKTSDESMDVSVNDFFQSQNEMELIILIFSCIENLLHIISINQHLDKLDVMLRDIANIFKLNSEQLLLGREELVINCIAYFDSLLFRGDIFALVQPACKIFTHLSQLHNTSQVKQCISQSVYKVLKRDWSNPSSYRQSVFEEVVKLFVHFHESPLLAIEEIAGIAVPELLLEDCTKSKLFPMLNFSTLHAFYKVMFLELVIELKSLQDPLFHPSDPMDLHVQRLFTLEISVRLFAILVNIVKSFDGRLFLGTVLKNGRLYIDLFLKLGMPLLDYVFREKNSEVTSLLKSMQQGTRCLQHYCTHSKNLKDVLLTRHVPLLRKTLETFVFRVKAMLNVNNCTDAFTIGNLKNKNLQGDIIESQNLDESLGSIHTDL